VIGLLGFFMDQGFRYVEQRFLWVNRMR